jgi:pilus assembly protein CpaE
MYPFSIGILVDDANLRNELISTLGDFPCRITADLADCRTVEQTLRRIVSTRPDVVFAEISERHGGADSLIPEVRQAMPNPMVVGLHPSATVDVVVAALRAGVNEFLQAPIRENLRAFMGRLQSGFRRQGQGKLVGFISGKGGCGSTTLACHTAVEVARRAVEQRKRALLMDFDLNAGLTRFMLKSENAYSVCDAINNLAKLDIEYWRRLVCSSHPGLDVLSAPEPWDARSPIQREHIEHVLGFVRAHYDWAILDLGKGFGQLADAALNEINEVYLITTAEIGSLHTTRRLINSLEKAGYSRDRIRLVLNRAPKSLPGLVNDIEGAVGIPVSISLANQYEALVECSLSGTLLSNYNKLALGINALASQVMDEAIVANRRSRMSRALTLCTAWMSA